MATSGKKDFELLYADALDEAFSRIGITPETVSTEHLVSAKRSLDILLIDWENEFTFNGKVSEAVVPLTAGDSTYVLDSDVVEVLSAISVVDGSDFCIKRISRSEYHNINAKDVLCSRPTSYFLEKLDAGFVVRLYPTPSDSTVTIKLYVMKTFEDVGGIRYTPDLARRYYPAICAGLTYKLAEKYKPELMESKYALAQRAIQVANAREAGTASIKMRVKLNRRR
jgi:hypothetical protein